MFSIKSEDESIKRPELPRKVETPNDERFQELKELCEEAAAQFKEDKSSQGQKLFLIFLTLFQSLDNVKASAREISNHAHKYDYEGLEANGFRSFLRNLDVIMVKTIVLSKEIQTRKGSYFFRKATYSKELDAHVGVIQSLHSCLKHLAVLMSWTEGGCLFPPQHHSIRELIGEDNVFVNQYVFYGRCLGFQFCDSLAPVLKALTTLMASFSEVYYGGRVVDSLWQGSKYFIDPELRAKRVVNISQYTSAAFCKNFWFLGEMELMTRLPSFVCPSLVVNKLISIEPEIVLLNGRTGSILQIRPPSAHKGHAPLTLRLMSSSMRFGMEESSSKEGFKSTSPALIFHCHGGGFVAQSSRSHETYLREWALGIDCPIVSVDYSLAPECPYPRALDEAFYAYCWVLANSHILGSSAEKIIFAGDSAGANLNIGVITKCIKLGVRIPDGIFLAYPPVVISFLPSPSRMLCLMDPLLPFGFVLNCSKAYASSPNAYQASVRHEYKLRKNLRRQDFRQDQGPASNSSDDDLIELDDDRAIPALMDDEAKDNVGLVSKVTNLITSKLPAFPAMKFSMSEDKVEKEIMTEALLPCPLDMMDFEVPHDPLISPFYLPESTLRQFPPATILTTHLDPFLDDCVEFSKRLRRAGNKIHLEVLSGLSHGFLNFSMLSNEAHEASKRCMGLIANLIDDPDLNGEIP